MRSCLVIVWLLLLNCASVANCAKPVDFHRDIRPILANHCYKCHGRDARRRRLVRLDRPQQLRRVIHPGSPAKSKLWQRVISADADTRMPPPKFSKRLSPSQLEALRRWIQSGAPFPRHWAFVNAVRPTRPVVKNVHWTRNEIDRFVLARLEQAQVSPSPPADQRVLARRLSLDLLGLPPTPQQVAQFLNDRRPDAYERLVAGMLASPHFGERMAQDWLDAARYADTTGHAADVPRTMWLYRDWVIAAYNRDMPFDQFTIEQLAGDMLPDATESQLIATGFHRNSMQALGNNPRKEEFRIKGIVDRLDTTGRVWLGLTLACAECHDHKYDPISTREYYQLFAIFNNVPHLGQRFQVHGPRIRVLNRQQKLRWKQLQLVVRRLQRRLARHTPLAVQQRQRRWEKDPTQWPWEKRGLVYRLTGTDKHNDGPGPWGKPRAVAISKENRPREFRLHGSEFRQQLTISAWVKTKTAIGDIVSTYDWRAKKRSFVFGIGGEGEKGATPGRLFAWVSGTADRFSGFEIYGTIAVNDGKWHHVALVAAERNTHPQLYVDGKLDRRAKITAFPAAIAKPQRPLAVGAGYRNSTTPNAFFLEGLISDLRVYSRAISTMPTLGSGSREVRTALQLPRQQRSTKQRSSISSHYRQLDPELRGLRLAIERARRGQRIVQSQAVTAQVMRELKKPRPTFIHIRGNFENPGARVYPGTPKFLPPLPSGQSPNRLSFARWLVNGRHPLTARVAVNRLWARFFGSGLVATSDDFGVRGQAPTHPELLDWLSAEFVESGWQVKSLVRKIVTSATYRQSSHIQPALFKRDPTNRLLARAMRFRLPAEQIRDNALALSGLLDARLGGPSVYPLQPEGVGQFRDNTAGKWLITEGGDLYRRGIYTFWQRMSPYPSLTMFDMPSRERSCTRRSITSTPLQALTLLNDPVFVEMAQMLGDRVRRNNLGRSAAQRVGYAFNLVLGRPPTKGEEKAFLAFIARQRREQKPLSHIWMLVAQVLLNLDETMTRE